MTDAPAFLRRKPRAEGHATLETGVRDIIASLNAQADADTAEILAGGINLYSAATICFRGSSSFTARDIQQLFAVWQILLDVKVTTEPDYSGRNEHQPESQE